MTDLRRALTNAIRLLEREAVQRRLSIEGGAQEFEKDAEALRSLLGPEFPYALRAGACQLGQAAQIIENVAGKSAHAQALVARLFAQAKLLADVAGRGPN